MENNRVEDIKETKDKIAEFNNDIEALALCLREARKLRDMLWTFWAEKELSEIKHREGSEDNAS